MMYAILQVVILGAALVFSIQHMARKLMPRTMKRLTQAILPGAPAKSETGSGCGDSGSCGTCNSCGTVAAMLRDLPPR